jgi:hypothetical protein
LKVQLFQNPIIRTAGMLILRQGDIALIRLTATQTPEGIQAERDAGNRLVLARGEATGHAHAIHDKGANLIVANDAVYLEVIEPVSLRHEEHAPISVPAGLYEVRRQVEWSDDDEPIRVTD